MTLRPPLSASSGGSVLCFHSLTTADLPATSLMHLPLERFAQLVAAVRRVAQIVPLTAMLDQHRQRRSTRGLAAITFDDGYASLLEAADLIRTENIPVTVFVTTGASGTGASFWWDRIEDLHPRVDPARWRQFEHGLGLDEAYRRGQPREFGPLRPLRQWILRVHGGRWPPGHESSLAQLETHTGFATRHRAMTFEELVRIGALSQVEFGVHTVTHPVLPLLGDAEAVDEIREAHQVLQRALPRVAPVLAIPFGLYDAQTERQGRDAGMLASLTLAGRTWGGYRSGGALPRFGMNRREPSWKLGLKVTGLAELLFGWRLEGGRTPPLLPSSTT